MNPYQEARLEKVTLNIGIGNAGERLEGAKTLLERISGTKAVFTTAKTRQSTFKVKKGQNIGVKTTIRGAKAKEVVAKCLETVDRKIKTTSFDKFGNVAFGVKEYIDIPGMKYDPKIGMMGFDICLTLYKPGRRVIKRRIGKGRLPTRQRVSVEESRAFMEKTFQSIIEDPNREQ